jgi:dTMP kinase
MQKEDTNKNLFIVIEGLDGTGKSTITLGLSKLLGCQNYKTPPNPFNKFRTYVDNSQDYVSRFFYYITSVLFASNEIKKMLIGNHVVCDRYFYSTFAYHYALDNNLKEYNLEKLLNTIIKPDYVFFLKADYTTRISRICQRENLDLKVLLEDQINHKEFSDKIETEFGKYSELIPIDSQILSSEEIIKLILVKIQSRNEQRSN